MPLFALRMHHTGFNALSGICGQFEGQNVSAGFCVGKKGISHSVFIAAFSAEA